MKDPKKPELTGVTRFLIRLPLYVRMGWAAFVVFALVGNCSGHREEAVACLALVSVMWVGMRILAEATEAWHILSSAKKAEAGEDPPAPGDDKNEPK